MNLNAGEISSLIKEQIKGFEGQLEDDDVGTVAGGDQQAARTEMLNHVVDGAGTEGHGLQATAVQLTLVQDLGGQMLGEILGARGDQLGVPRDAT